MGVPVDPCVAAVGTTFLVIGLAGAVFSNL
jgi:hypothetical protein